MSTKSRASTAGAKALRLAAIVGVLALTTNDAEAQKRRATPRAASKAAPKPDPVGNLVGAIAINSLRDGETLFTACDRSEFKVLAWALDQMRSKIALEKGEYETEAEFAARRRKLEDVINQDGQLVVCQPLDDNEDAPFRYDPEREAFNGTFSARQNVWRDVKRTGSYVSRTRMGVRATVRSSVQIEYDVDFGSALRDHRPACLKGSYLFEYQVPIPRNDAPLVKARGYLVFTGRLVSPFVDRSDTEGSPTLDNPTDVYERSLTVSFEPSRVSVVGPTGQSVWSCDLR